MRETRISIARKDIIKAFDEIGTNVLRAREISEILSQNREFWRLTKSMTFDQFVGYMLESTPLKREVIPFRKPETRYIWRDVPMLEVLMHIHPEGYLSHYGAMRLHGLTEQLPKTIYLNIEQKFVPSNTPLTQRKIDYAFRQAPRISTNIAPWRGYEVIQINGRSTRNAGVVEKSVLDYTEQSAARVRVTGIERTLIDIAVRPMNSGGVGEVVKAYALAAERCSINKLVALLKQIDYTYPYHQNIGFYMELSGEYSQKSLALLKEFPQEHDFYLTYQIDKPLYSDTWKIFYPSGLQRTTNN